MDSKSITMFHLCFTVSQLLWNQGCTRVRLFFFKHGQDIKHCIKLLKSDVHLNRKVYGVFYVWLHTVKCLYAFEILSALYASVFFINPGSDVTSLHPHLESGFLPEKSVT